jgi:hypothetical protein
LGIAEKWKCCGLSSLEVVDWDAYLFLLGDEAGCGCGIGEDVLCKNNTVSKT